MPTLTTELKEIANFAAVAWEWSDTYHGIEYEGVEGTYLHQILWLRDVDRLFYITKAPLAETWGPWVPIKNPERFGFDNTLKSARAAAKAFYADGKGTV